MLDIVCSQPLCRETKLFGSRDEISIDFNEDTGTKLDGLSRIVVGVNGSGTSPNIV